MNATAYTRNETTDAECLRKILDHHDADRKASPFSLAAGPRGRDAGLFAALQSTLDDPSEQVSNAAVRSLGHIRSQNLAAKLVVATRSAESTHGVAALAGAAIIVGDTGFGGVNKPTWRSRLLRSEPLNRFPKMERHNYRTGEKVSEECDGGRTNGRQFELSTLGGQDCITQTLTLDEPHPASKDFTEINASERRYGD